MNWRQFLLGGSVGGFSGGSYGCAVLNVGPLVLAWWGREGQRWPWSADP